MSLHPLARSLPVLAATALALPGCFTRPALPDAGLLIGPRTADARFDVQVAQTANGLRYALVPDARSNLITVDVRYTAGAADDPAGKTGLAHMVEHLTYTQATTAGGPSLAQRLDQLALSYNAYTNWDETNYTATGLATNLDAILALEAERMASPCERVSPDMLERERQVVLNESRERGEDLWSAVSKQLFGAEHPYAHSVGGTDVAKVTRDDVCAFLASHYAPSRAILVVVGPFDPAAVKGQIEARFAGIQRAPGTQRELPAVATTGESVHNADIEEPTALIAFPSPPWGKTGNESRDLVIDLWIRRAQGQGESAGITGIRRGYLGGFRGGVDVITVRTKEWSQLQGAVNAVFAARDQLLADDFTLARRDTRSTHVNGHLASLESISGMGIRVADYLQYADHPWFMIQGFNESENLWPEGLAVKFRQVEGYYGSRLVDYAEDAPQLRAVIDRLPVRGTAHIAWIRPDKTAPAMDAAPPTDIPRVEVAEWKPPVDVSEADRALELPGLAPRTTLTRYNLRNGMHVVMAPVPRAPMVDIRVVFPAGTLNDPVSQPGLATLAAYMIDHEVPNDLTQDEFTRAYWALGLGTRMSADLDIDTTVFRAGGAARYADWHMWRLFWMLDQGEYDPDTLARFRSDLKPAERPSLSTVLAQALVGTAAVREPNPMLTATISVRELEAFRDEHYLPRGATLVVTGGFEPSAMAATIEKLWGSWSDDKAPPVPYKKVTPAPKRERHFAVEDDKARQLTVALAFPAATAEMATRMVLQEMVASQVRSVRGRLGVTYGIAATYELLSDVAPTLLISGEVDPDRGGDAIKALLASLEDLRADKAAFTRAFVAARRRVLGKVIARVSDTSALAGELEGLARSGWTRNELDALTREVAAIKPATVSAALGRDMVAAKMVVALSGRRTVVEKACRDAGLASPLFLLSPKR